MNQQQLLKLDALLQRLLTYYQKISRNPQNPGPADIADDISNYIKDMINQPGPIPDKTRDKPWRGNA